MATKVRKAITVNPETSAAFGHKVGDRLSAGLANGVGSLIGLTAGALWGVATGIGKVASSALDRLNLEEEVAAPAAVVASPVVDEVVQLTQEEINAMIAQGVAEGVKQVMASQPQSPLVRP